MLMEAQSAYRTIKVQSQETGFGAEVTGVYLSRPDGTEQQSGFVEYSTPASGNRWYVAGVALGIGDKLVALAQCIL